MKYNQRWIFPVVSCWIFLGTTTWAFIPSQSRSSNTPSTFTSSRSLTSCTRLFAVTLPEGIIKQIEKEGNGDPVKLGDIATVKYTCYLPEDEKAAPFARSTKQKMVVGDGTMVTGWEKALRTMTVGERAIIRVTDPKLGYGSTGVPPLIPPDAQLEFDIEVLNTQPPTTNIDFDSLATADNTPRTAAEISAAYEKRRALKALEGPEKEGLEGFIEKAKNFYFFGLFEGETGQQAPWFLRPSITFPLAFLVVGAAFYVSYISGAISERGATVTDELDEVILSMSTMSPSSSSSALMAMMLALTARFDLGL